VAFNQIEYQREYDSRPEVIERKRKYSKEYDSRPEVKERKREYDLRPEVIERRREYNSRPEVKEQKKKYAKEYHSRPEVIERRREYNSRPEVIERKREYDKEYHLRPEVKEQKKKYDKEYHSRPEVKERKRERQKKWTASATGRLSSVKYRSKKKNLEFNLTKKYLESIYPENNTCPLLNIPLDWDSDPKHPTTPSIDRIDSSKGYIKGNVQWVSWRANTLKGDGTPDELLMIAQNYKKIYDQTLVAQLDRATDF
jgi:hypothetical protein